MRSPARVSSNASWSARPERSTPPPRARHGPRRRRTPPTPSTGSPARASTVCFAVGAAGTIDATATGGIIWGTQTSHTASALAGISCPSITVCFAVGAAGTIDATTTAGVTWATQTSHTASALAGISCPSITVCFAVGAGGTIDATTNGGTTWATQTSNTANALNGISCPFTTVCFAVGAAGTIVATTNGGTTWAAQTSGTANALQGVSFPSGLSRGWAVGAAGTIDEYSCTGGSLSLTSPSPLTFAPLTLNGTNQSTTGTLTLTPDDETGALAGWNISAYATTFTDGTDTLPTPTITAATAAATTDTCSLPTNSVAYPTGALGTTSGTATKLFNAALGTGFGGASVALTFSLQVPAKQLIKTPSPDTFSSTVTVTIASGP